MMTNLRLEPGDLAFYFQTNGTIGAERLAMFLELLGSAWRNEDLPPYALDILELRTGSLFGKLRLRMLAALTPDAEATLQDRVNDLEKRVSRRRKTADERSADAAERQARAAEASNEIQRETLRTAKLGIAVTAALGAATLVYGIAHDAMREEGSYCADLLAQIMDRDGVSLFKLATADFQIDLTRDDVPAYQHRLDEPKSPDDDDLRMHPTRANGIAFPGSAHFPSGADTPPEVLPGMGAGGGVDDIRRAKGRGIDAARPAAPTSGRAPIGDRFDAPGRLMFADNACLLILDAAPEGRIILIPPQGQQLADGRRYQVTGRLFMPLGEADIVAADLMQPLD